LVCPHPNRWEAGKQQAGLVGVRAQLGHDLAASGGDTWHNGGANNSAQTHNSSGQNHPVNSHSTSFVVFKGFEDVQQVHDISLSIGLFAHIKAVILQGL
jgi:hypothetical protein